MARVLITGSNSGFGRLSAVSLAKQGHEVIATMRNLDKGADLVAERDRAGLPIETRRLDVCDPDSVAEALADAADIDVLVNNAGFEIQSAVELVDDDMLMRQFDTNVAGPMRTIRAVLPAWRERGSGTIVNVSSIAGLVGAPYGGVYAASKHALEALSEALHFEISQLGIRVRLVEPGRFATDFGSNIVTPDGWEDSFYHERAMAFRSALTSLDGDGDGDAGDAEDAGADPQLVADAIVRAAVDPDAPFRQLVGADAELIAGVKRAMSFEEFEAAMRQTLDWHD